MKLGGIYVSVGAKLAGYKKDLAKAHGMTKKSTKRMQIDINKLNFRAAGVAALAFAGTMAYAMKKSIDAASDLQETQGKFDVVFKGQETRAEAWSETLQSAYAMSSREAKFYLSSVQDLLVPMGMNANAAANMSNQIVQLSADLGSFNNLDTATVMLDMQSALVGNFETMKKYGVVLNATVVAQKAISMGLVKNKKQLTAATKAQAAYQLMVEGSAAAVGDMARTSGSYANQLKDMKAKLEDFAASAGQLLLPTMTNIVSGLRDVMIASEPVVEFFSMKWMAGAQTVTEKNMEDLDMLERKLATLSRARKGIPLMDKASLAASAEAIALVNTQIATLEKTMSKMPPAIIPKVVTPGGGGGGGGGPDPKDQAKLELETALKAIKYEDEARSLARKDEIERSNAQIEREKEQSAEKIGAIIEAHENALSIIEEKKEAEIAAMNAIAQGEQWLLEQKKKMEKDKVAIGKKGLDQALGDSASFFKSMGQQNEIAFALFKATSMARTAMAGKEAAVQAYKWGNAFGGPVAGVAFAAASLAWTGAQLADIAGMSGGGGGGSSMGGGGAMSSGGSVGTYSASPTTGLPETEEQTQTINVNIENFVDSEENRRNFAEWLNDFVEDKGGRLVASDARFAEATR